MYKHPNHTSMHRNTYIEITDINNIPTTYFFRGHHKATVEDTNTSTTIFCRWWKYVTLLDSYIDLRCGSLSSVPKHGVRRSVGFVEKNSTLYLPLIKANAGKAVGYQFADTVVWFLICWYPERICILCVAHYEYRQVIADRHKTYSNTIGDWCGVMLSGVRIMWCVPSFFVPYVTPEFMHLIWVLWSFNLQIYGLFKGIACWRLVLLCYLLGV